MVTAFTQLTPVAVAPTGAQGDLLKTVVANSHLYTLQPLICPPHLLPLLLPLACRFTRPCLTC